MQTSGGNNSEHRHSEIEYFSTLNNQIISFLNTSVIVSEYGDLHWSDTVIDLQLYMKQLL